MLTSLSLYINHTDDRGTCFAHLPRRVLYHPGTGPSAMGRTCPTYRMLLEEEIASWGGFRAALGKEDRAALDRLFDSARRHASACSFACRLDPFEGMVVGMLVSLADDDR